MINQFDYDLFKEYKPINMIDLKVKQIGKITNPGSNLMPPQYWSIYGWNSLHVTTNT
jgi:hypothetical protein